MPNLAHQRILLGVSGGIAAYKSAILARRLIEAGAEVRVVMTAGACAFVQPLTFQALTGNPVHTDLLNPAAEAAMGHIEQARWATHILIAPASANTLARLAHGLADDLLSTLCLASEAPISVAPAMNRVMWQAAATQANCATLRERGFGFFGPAEGAQACGETGAGRMLEPEAIRDALLASVHSNAPDASLASPHPTRGDAPGAQTQKLAGTSRPADNTRATHKNDLAGHHVLITAGPTVEPIDPVRYLSNRSSGKMGFALAAAAAARGARVTLVAGPVSLDTPTGVTRVDVQSAQDMHEAVMAQVTNADVFIAVAAVADYRAQDVPGHKIKKNAGQMSLLLVRNPDILQAVADRNPRPFCVGFAAETDDLANYARGKLQRKKLDMIAANLVAQPDAPVFNSKHNALQVFWGEDGVASIERAPKPEVADRLLDLIGQRLRLAVSP